MGLDPVLIHAVVAEDLEAGPRNAHTDGATPWRHCRNRRICGPRRPNGASFETNELPRTFGNLKILFYEDTVAVPKWGRQRVPRRGGRFIAQRE